jgi:hypothetical protein
MKLGMKIMVLEPLHPISVLFNSIINMVTMQTCEVKTPPAIKGSEGLCGNVFLKTYNC